MANGVNVKMGVSGVAQFKQGMKESQASVKSLEQALKLNEQALKLNGDQQQYMENKTKLLERQIAEQTNVVKQAEAALTSMRRNGVEQGSVAFQKMQEQSYKAQTDLLAMQESLYGLGEAGEEAQSGISNMNAAMQRIGTHVDFDAVINGISKVTGGLEAAAKKAIDLGKKLVSAMLTGGQWADDLQTTADQWEMTPEQVYRMRQTANLIDTDAETIFQARQKLIKAMGQNDNKDTMGAFAALGISNLTGTDKNIENVFWNAGEALMQMTDKVARNEYAMKLYGRSWTDLIPIFKAGRQTYEETMASWTWIGDEQFEKLTALDDESQKLTTEWQMFQAQFEAALAPAMTSIMETLRGLLEEFNKYLQTEEGQQMLENLGKAVEGLFEDLTKIDPKKVMKGLKDVFDKLIEGLKWVWDNKQDIVNALKYIVEGWAALKITGGALQIMKLINGVTGLVGGSAAARMAGEAAGKSWAGGFSSAATFVIKSVPWIAGLFALTDTSNHASSEASDNVVGQAANGDQFAQSQLDFMEERYGVTAEEVALLDDFGNVVEKGWATLEDLDALLKQKYGLTPLTGTTGTPSYNGEGQAYVEAVSDEVVHKMRNRKNEFTGGEYIQRADRMTQVAGEMSEQVAGMNQKTADMTSAIQALKALPADMQTSIVNAVISGMNAVTIVINESGIDTIGRRVSSIMGQKVLGGSK